MKAENLHIAVAFWGLLKAEHLHNTGLLAAPLKAVYITMMFIGNII